MIRYINVFLLIFIIKIVVYNVILIVFSVFELFGEFFIILVVLFIIIWFCVNFIKDFCFNLIYFKFFEKKVVFFILMSCKLVE